MTRGGCRAPVGTVAGDPPGDLIRDDLPAAARALLTLIGLALLALTALTAAACRGVIAWRAGHDRRSSLA